MRPKFILVTVCVLMSMRMHALSKPRPLLTNVRVLQTLGLADEAHVELTDDHHLLISVMRTGDPSGKWKLFVEGFEIATSGLHNTFHLSFPVSGTSAQAQALPDGTFVVNDGKSLYRFDLHGSLASQQSIRDICGNAADIEPSGSIRLYITSQKISVLQILQRFKAAGQPDKKEPDSVGTLYCWLRNDNYQKVASLYSKYASPHATAQDMRLYTLSPGYTKVISPDGASDVKPDVSCKSNTLIDNRAVVLLHKPDSSLTICDPDSIQVAESGSKRTLRRRRGIASFVTNSWRAPVVLLIMGEVKTRTLGFSSASRLELINVDTGNTIELPSLKETVTTEIAVNGRVTASISPDATTVAVLHGTQLSIYGIDHEFGSPR